MQGTLSPVASALGPSYHMAWGLWIKHLALREIRILAPPLSFYNVETKVQIVLRAGLGALFTDTSLHAWAHGLLEKRASCQRACSVCPGPPPDLSLSLWSSERAT